MAHHVFRHEHGIETFPLCTLNVSPTKSGVIMDGATQVLIGALGLGVLAFTIFQQMPIR